MEFLYAQRRFLENFQRTAAKESLVSLQHIGYTRRYLHMSERAEVLPVTRLVIAIDNSVIQMLGRDAGGDRPYLRDLQQCRLSTYPLHNYLGYYALIIADQLALGPVEGAGWV